MVCCNCGREITESEQAFKLSLAIRGATGERVLESRDVVLCRKCGPEAWLDIMGSLPNERGR